MWRMLERMAKGDSTYKEIDLLFDVTKQISNTLGELVIKNSFSGSATIKYYGTYVILSEILGVTNIFWLNQEHGTRCVQVEGVGTPSPLADGAWTKKSGIALAVLTADCVPIVLADKEGCSIAIAHAGWRGIASGIVDQIVNSISATHLSSIVAWIGPAIGKDYYEIDVEVREAISSSIKGVDDFFVRTVSDQSKVKYYADLSGIVSHRLLQLGLKDISGGGICSASDRRFYSYRRDAVTGRMATLVWRDK